MVNNTQIRGSIIEFADNCKPGFTFVTTGTSTNTYAGIGSMYTVGFVLYRSNTTGVIVLFSYVRKEIYIIFKNEVWDSSATVIK